MPIRNCYQKLKNYLDNGTVPIVAPTPVQTQPFIFKSFKPHKFKQTDYLMSVSNKADLNEKVWRSYPTISKQYKNC